MRCRHCYAPVQQKPWGFEHMVPLWDEGDPANSATSRWCISCGQVVPGCHGRALKPSDVEDPHQPDDKLCTCAECCQAMFDYRPPELVVVEVEWVCPTCGQRKITEPRKGLVICAGNPKTGRAHWAVAMERIEHKEER